MTWEQLADGYGLIEGPTIDRDGALLFSDVPNGGVYRLDADRQVEEVVPKRRGVGGIALHADGGMVLSGRNVCHVLDGETRVILDRESDQMAFNDLACDAAGRVYVGTLIGYGDRHEHRPGHLLRVELDRSVTTLYGNVRLTNGIGFSPAGGTLYHSDTRAKALIVHDLAGDGSPENRRLFTHDDDFAPDGLAVSVDGGIWVACAGAGRVVHFDPAGRVIDEVDAPTAAVTSVCFDGDTLHAVTMDGLVLRRPGVAEGTPVHPARV